MAVWMRGTIVVLIGLLPLLEGCTRHSESERYYLIGTNLDVAYWKTASEGFQKAAAEFGVTADTRGPGSFDPQAEVEEFRKVVATKPAGILVPVAGSSPLLALEIPSAAITAGDSRHRWMDLGFAGEQAPVLYRHRMSNLEAGFHGQASRGGGKY